MFEGSRYRDGDAYLGNNVVIKSLSHPKKCVLVRNAVHFLTFVLVLCVLRLRTLRLNQDRVLFLNGVHLPAQSKDKMYLFQEHSALENIKYILSLD